MNEKDLKSFEETHEGSTPSLRTINYLWRFHEARWSEHRLQLIKESFPVIKYTNCGVWIDVYGRKRFVNLGARKKYACLTEQEALESYHARKKRQVRILKLRLAEAEAALTLNMDNISAYWPLGDL